MPIIIKDYTWTQSEAKLCINLPLKGTKASNIDVLSSLEFLKVSYPPFLFECWFYDKVKDEEVVAIVNNGIISLQFNKEEEKSWPSLMHPDYENKEKLKKIRDDAIVFSGERAKRLVEQKSEIKIQNQKTALKEQMKIEEEERKRIEKVKEDERQRATQEIEKFKQKQHEFSKISDVTEEAKNPVQSEAELVKDDNKKLWSDNEKDIFNQEIKSELKKQKDKEERENIAPRQSGSIQIKFTPRVFPTPSRESQNKLEREWLENQAEARKLTQLPEELKDLTENETNLDWLKEKANKFYKQENYQTAIGVYNHAIRIFPKVPSLYSNRAACHFKVRNLIKCVEDCTRALELLTPPVADNAASRLRSHIRRGTAFCQLELYAEGLLDYEAAIKIDPDNREIREDAENIRKIIVGTPPDDDDDKNSPIIIS